MAAISSFGTTVTFGGASSNTVRTVDVSNQSISMVDTTPLNTTGVKQIVGIKQVATISVTTLDRESWAIGGAGSTLVVNWGGLTSVDYGTCIMTSGPNGAAAMDAAVEFQYTFEMKDGDPE